MREGVGGETGWEGGGWMVREGVDDEGVRVRVNGERGWV